MADPETLVAYDQRAAEYARKFESVRPDRHLATFVEALPNAAQVLDLGCGPGQAANFMSRAGLRVEAWDASPEMARVASDTFGLDVKVAEFTDLAAENVFDGIYANFSLLHAPRSEMPAHLLNICKALKSKGVFHIGMKTGQGEQRDSLGRLYTFYADAELSALLEDAGFTVTNRTTGSEVGLAGTNDPWIIMLARKVD